jgi:cellobiose phosphorylase/cellobionic acid phosphorylase
MADELGRAIRESLSRRDGAYAYGYDDAGARFGDEADGRTFLNTQSWGLMSSRAAGDTDDVSAAGCRQAIQALSTPWGPRLLDPAFRGWDPQIGRVSLKVPGTTENGSVYCHASVFAAYGLAMNGDTDASLDIMLRTIPGHPDHANGEVPQQLPLYQPNSYFYEPGHPQCGLSTGTLGTGTCTWMVLTVFQQYFGISFTRTGLRVKPSLPAGWDHAAVEFVRSGTRVRIRVERSSDGTAATIVNGRQHREAAAIAWEKESQLDIVVRC